MCIRDSSGATSGSAPSAQSAVATLRSCARLSRDPAWAETTSRSRPASVSSISEPSWPAPNCTNARKPASCMAEISGRNRTGSSK